MSLDMNDYRPIFSGLVGTILAAILAWYICKNTPSLLSNNQLEDVKKNYGKRVDVANFLSLLRVAPMKNDTGEVKSLRHHS
jgi:hypothetical protein